VKKVRLGDTAKFINGAAFKPSDWADDGLPIIRIQNLTGTGESFNRTNRIVRPELVVEPGDLLVSWSATLDAYRWTGPRGVLNQHIFKVLPNEGVHPDYLYFALREVISELEQKTHGSTMKHVVRGDFESTEIPLPPLSEQERLVDLLSRAENIVRMRREAEQKAKEIIPALFLDMFGDPARNEKRWERQHLGEIVRSIDSGKSPKCEDRARAPGEWGVLKLGAVTWGQYDESEYKVLPPNMKPYSASEVRAGDLLISRKNTSELVGASAYVWGTKGRMLLPDLIFRLDIADADIVDPIYLWALLSTDAKRNQLRSMASGAAASMPNISKGRLATLPIELPPIRAQRAFADRVRQARELEDQQGRAMAHADRAFQSLLAGVFIE
jgi:type I restriction enzyme S subunit